MDILLTPRTRALILRYEHDRPVSESAARDTLIRSGQEGDRDIADVVLHKHDPTVLVRKQKPQEWALAFNENERFASALLQKEVELGLDHLPVHLFGCAPLVLMLHLASCLPRRPLRVYQQAPDGTWSLGHDRAQQPASEDFFQVEGLPATRQGGHGRVALIVEVTNPIHDKALLAFQAKYPSDLLATVRLSPARGGPSITAVQHPDELSRAVVQFRSVLDALHERLVGAESVLLAMNGPASLAAALGAAINPNAQHPLWLYHFDPDQSSYLLVHEIRHRRAASAQATPLTVDEYKEAVRVLEDVRKVHQELVDWLKKPGQRSRAEEVGGESLLQSQVVGTPATEVEPFFRYLQGEWRFHIDLLLALKALRDRLQSPEDWKECIRLILLHEAYHVRQEGLSSYNYSGSGRMGWVLEAVDFDADAVSVQAALAFREATQPGHIKAEGRTRAVEAIVWNMLEALRMFEPEHPVRELSERRLRRYLIWLFHACRLNALSRGHKDSTQLERVFIELSGLKSFPDPHESYPQQRVRLEDVDSGEAPGVAVYYRGKLARVMDKSWVVDLLQAIRRWDELPRVDAQDRVTLCFHRLFDRHRFLIEPGE